MRVHATLSRNVRVIALTSSVGRMAPLRAAGITPLLGDLDMPPTLRRLSGLATRVLHLAPPPLQDNVDLRTLALVRALRLRTPPVSLVYGSTSGVYGDCHGQWVDESRVVHPQTPRATRRVAAERLLRWLGRTSGVRISILRIPGIYAADREGGTPHARLQNATPVLQAQDDVYTNHIHANDLARACKSALYRGLAQRVYNINDDSCLKMGDYFDLAADLYGLPRPPRISAEEATGRLSAMQLSFMLESRRMVNHRMKQELRLRLRYPTVVHGLEARPADAERRT